MQDTSITVGTKNYARFREEADKTTYVGTSHDVGNVDILLLSRTVPTSVGQQAKIRANFVQDASITDAAGTSTNVGRLYASIDASVPAAATQEHRDELLADLRAYVLTQSFTDLFNKQSI